MFMFNSIVVCSSMLECGAVRREWTSSTATGGGHKPTSCELRGHKWDSRIPLPQLSTASVLYETHGRVSTQA